MSGTLLEEQQACCPTVPNYLLLEKLGQGGMGEVFLARNKDNELVAIKLLVAPEDKKRKELLPRFEREMRLLVSLDHPNIVRVLDSGVANGRPFFVMEYVPRGNLREHMTPGLPFALQTVREILVGVLSGLKALEAKQIVHRDLKPENVLVGEEGGVKITDFGISAAETEVGQLTSTAQILGTFDYMSPEQRARLPVDTRSDQFSLAVMVYELLTGKRPLGNFKPASEVNRQLHPVIDGVLARALREDPDDRYPCVSEFAEAILAGLDRKPQTSFRFVLGFVVVAFVLALSLWVEFGWLGTPEPRDQDTSGKQDVVKARPGKVIGPRNPEKVYVDPKAKPTAKPKPEPEANKRPKDPSAKVPYYLQQGDKHLEAGRDRDAELCYAEAIRISRPDDARGYLKRAFVYKKNRLYQKALDDLKAALDREPKRIEAWTGVGAIYVQLKDYETAIAPLSKAAELDSEASEALAWRGWARHKLGQKDIAGDDLDRAIVANGSCGVAYQFRALFHRTHRNYAQSLKDFEAAVRCMPDNPYMHSSLANMLALCPDKKLRDPARAIEHAKKACELTQWGGPGSLRYLAQAYSANGEPGKAVHWAEKSLALTPVLSQRKIRGELAVYRKRLAAQKRSSP